MKYNNHWSWVSSTSFSIFWQVYWHNFFLLFELIHLYFSLLFSEKKIPTIFTFRLMPTNLLPLMFFLSIVFFLRLRYRIKLNTITNNYFYRFYNLISVAVNEPILYRRRLTSVFISCQNWSEQKKWIELCQFSDLWTIAMRLHFREHWND